MPGRLEIWVDSDYRSTRGLLANEALGVKWSAHDSVESDSWDHGAVRPRRQPWEDVDIHRSSVDASSI